MLPKTFVHLSGPYTGTSPLKREAEAQTKKNIERAKAIAGELWGKGYAVLCPHTNTAEFEKISTATYDDYLSGDLQMVDRVDAVIMLPLWQSSKGAMLEFARAQARGIPIYEYPELPPADPDELPKKPSNCLMEANKLVDGNRGKDYGHPFHDFSKTAKMITGLLLDLLRPGVEVPPERVPLMMVAVKMSRLVQTPTHHDSIVDGPGYFRVYEKIIEHPEWTLKE